MTEALLKDLEKLVDKHKEAEKPYRICWIPICEHFKTASRVCVFDEKGGNTISTGKHGDTARVLCWVKVHVDSTPFLNIRILETSIDERR